MARINISQILMKRGNTTAANTYVGPLGELVVDTGLRTVRVQDGVTPGGMSTLATNVQLQALGTYANATFGTSSYGNANVALHLLTSSIIGNINANITAANAAITSLTSNAAIQAQAIANAAGTYGNANVESYIGANIGTLHTNAATQATSINAVNANIGGSQTYANTQVNTVSANLGAYQTFANANAATQATGINTVNANLGAYQTYGNLTFSTVANAATQATSIATLQTQVYANANVDTYLSSSVIGSLSTSGNLTVGGNLIVNGNSTIINTTTYTIDDNILQIADGNPADSLDLGFVGHRTAGAVLQHTGLVRDASAGNWRLFSNVTAQPGATIDFTNAVYDDIQVGAISSPTVTDLYANAAVQSANIATLFSNAATQATSIATLQTQVYANANVAEYLPTYSGNVRAEYVQLSFGLITTGASPAPSISGFSSISTAGNAVNEGNISASGNLVANRGAYITGNVTAGNINANQYNFANGVNILSTVAGTYANANVAEYLPTYSGNIAANIVKNGYTWTFSNTGTTTFPTGVRLSNARGANTVNFLTDVDKSFQIETQTSATSKLWNFTTDGNLTLPQNANINFSNGVSILSAVGAYQTFANANAATQATNINTINNTLTSSNVAIGLNTGSNAQSSSATAVGAFAGYDTQGVYTVAIGSGAGYTNQKQYAVAIGSTAGSDFQGAQAVAIGADAGYATQGAQAVAIGLQAGQVSQGTNTVAIGSGAGQNTQGASAVAIGFGAGQTNQGNNSIILNATGSVLNRTTASTFTVAPIREATGNVGVLQYNATTKEVTYSNTISINGTINANQYNFANGVNILSTVSAGSYGNTEVAAYLPTYSGNVRALNFVGAVQAQVGSSFSYATDAFGSLYDTGLVALPADTNSNAIVAGYTIVGNSGAVTLTVTSATFVAGTPNFISVSTTPTASSFAYPVTVYSADYVAALPNSSLTVGNATVSGNVTTQYVRISGGIISTGASPAPVISGFGSISTTGSAVNEGNITASGNLVASRGAYITGNVIAGNINANQYNFANGVNILSTVGGGAYSNTNVASYLTSGITTANLTVTGNVVQQSAYYETYGNISNSGGNLTCNFNLGTIFYAALTANVTANFTNVNAIASTVTGATIIVDQGATAYRVANVQVNGVNQTVRWVGAAIGTGTASNTDIMSFSLIHLGGAAYRVLGQISNYG